MYIKRRFSKDSLIGKVYFWYWNEIFEGFPPEKEDTCGVRKVLLLSMFWGTLRGLSYLIIPKVFGTRVRMWAVTLTALIVLGAFFLPDVVIGVIVATLLVLGGIGLAVVVVFGVVGIYRVLGFISRIALKAVPALENAWEFFWNEDIGNIWPIYPWMFAFGLTQILVGYHIISNKPPSGSIFHLIFGGFIFGEIVIICLIGVYHLSEWLERGGQEKVRGVIKPFKKVRAGFEPVRLGTLGILEQLFISIKNRVCFPVEWY